MSEAAEMAETEVVGLEGLAEAEAALELAEDRLDALQGSLGRARAALLAAEARRGQLIARVSEGNGEAGKQTVALAREIVDLQAQVTLLAEALPGAQGLVRRAEREVGGIKGAEKRRLAGLARAAYREAEAAVERAAAERDRTWTAWQIAERA